MKRKTYSLVLILLFGLVLVPVVEAGCHELKYDDGTDNIIVAGTPNTQLGVRFSLPENWRGAVVVRARFYFVVHATSDFIVHVYDLCGKDLVQPFVTAASSTGWFDVPLNVLVSCDFFIAIEYIYDEAPRLGGDTDSNPGRSYYRDLSTDPWGEPLPYNVMIRAVVCEAPPVGGELLPNTVSTVGIVAIAVVLIVGASTGLAFRKRRPI
jgi:hypothetical protein